MENENTFTRSHALINRWEQLRALSYCFHADEAAKMYEDEL